jgi:hypothetical protein
LLQKIGWVCNSGQATEAASSILITPLHFRQIDGRREMIGLATSAVQGRITKRQFKIEGESYLSQNLQF